MSSKIRAVAFFLVVAGMGAALTVLYLAGYKTVQAEIVIDASPKAVWAVLMDASSYEQWHPVINPISGPFEIGKTIPYRMKSPGGEVSEVESRVVGLDRWKFLNQYGGVPLVLTFNHEFKLEPVEGGTRVIQREEYRGIAVPFWNPDWVEQGYMRANEGLKAEVARRLKAQ
ncbi:MAG: SRPBCC domain-containing protein [Pseudomonadota bacterium]